MGPSTRTPVDDFLTAGQAGPRMVNEDPACRRVGAPDFQSRPLRVTLEFTVQD